MKLIHLGTLARTGALLVAALLAQQTALAENDPSSRVARLNYLRGSVSFQPAGEADWVPAVVNRPVTTGDRLWADDDARVEMQLGSSTIRLGALTGLSFFNLDDRITQIELSEGTLNIRVLRLDRDEIFEVDTPNQAFSILRPGQYRVEASEEGDSTMVTVWEGEGEVTGGGRTYGVGSGLSGSFEGADSLRASIFKAGGSDEFDRWCRDRDRRYDRSPSRRYVSVEVVGYQDLDDYGRWRSDRRYGNIWVPRVAAGWAPYQDGHWVWISPWGWTWVDDAPWGYAPFHYGRWVWLGSNWGWVPGPVAVRPVYAPALVVFVGGPRFSLSVSVGNRGPGYVGWFPLGPREVYVPTYRTSREYVSRVNVSNTTVNNITITNVYNNTENTNIRYSNKNVRGAVTAVSQTTFVSAHHVGKGAVVVNPQEITSAPVHRRAEVAPTRNSVLGPSAGSGNRAAQPPAKVVNRTIVAKTPPPPPPVPFERQQAKLAAQPGQPLAGNEIETLRPGNSSAARSRVQQAPPGRAATADSNLPPANVPGNSRQQTPSPTVANPPPTDAPAGRSDRPPNRSNRGGGGQPANVQDPTPASAPAVSNAPAGNTPASRDDRPPNRSNRGGGGQPANVQDPTPASAPAVSNAPAGNTPASRDDRPPNRSNRGGGGQPANVQDPTPASAPAVSNAPAGNTPASRDDRPPNRSNRGGGGQAANVQAPTPAPAPAVSNAPAGNTPASRDDRPPNRSNRGGGGQPANVQDPTPPPSVNNAPANNAPPSRDDRSPNRGNREGGQPSNAQPQAPTSNNAPSNAPPARGGNRGRAPEQTPQQSPNTTVASPASSNDQPSGRGNRGR